MNTNLKTKPDIRRIIIFLCFAFGIAWLAGLVIYLTGGLTNSPQILPGVTLALVLMATVYMGAPALGNILTRALTHENWKDVGLRPNFRKGWPYWLLGWFLPAVMTIVGAIIFFAIFPQYYDSSLTYIKQLVAGSPTFSTLSPWLVVLFQLGSGVLLAPLLNSLATFGEEFGWRAYLLPKLMPLGGRKAMLWIGLIWGVWHWPVIFMGYEYGFSYPGYPWVGPLLFLWVAFGLGVFLGWLYLRGKSVWPAVIGHAAINGIASASVLFTVGQPNPLLGPLPVGIIGSLGFALVSICLFTWPKALEA